MTKVHLWAGEKFCGLILDRERIPAGNLYCFNSAGLELLRAWHSGDGRSVLEQTIAPRRIEESLLSFERHAFPDWEAEQASSTYVEAYISREEAEWQLANTIICGSEFVRDGIAQCGGPVERCVVVPYGVPLDRFRPVEKAPRAGRKLRVLTVGEVGLRKGIPYVHAAAQQLAEHAEFRVVGPIALIPERQEKVAKTVLLTGAIPRSQIIEQFNWADVFLLPSICEGSATVTYEALSAGLPVIATPNTGSIVIDGESGFIVPIRDAEAITAALVRLLTEPGLFEQLRAGALQRSQTGSLEAYGQRLLQVLAP